MRLLVPEDVRERWGINDRIAGIYIITNLVNGKKYVGQTSNLRSRFSDYNSKTPRCLGVNVVQKKESNCRSD